MKFAVFAGAVTLFAGVLASPHAAPAIVAAEHVEHVERADVSTLLGSLKSQASSITSSSNDISSLLDKALAGQTDLLPNITKGLQLVNQTLTTVEGVVNKLLTSLGLGALTPIISAAGGDISSLVDGIVSLLEGVVTSLVGDLTGGLTLGSAVGLPSSLSSISNISSLSSVLSGIVNTVSALVAKIISGLQSGKLGTTSLIAKSKSTHAAVSGDVIADLLAAAVALLTNVLKLSL